MMKPRSLIPGLSTTPLAGLILLGVVLNGIVLNLAILALFALTGNDSVARAAAGVVLNPRQPAANTWYVAPGGDDGDDCLSPGSACASIAAAVDKAFDGDTIEVAAGVYDEHDIEVYKQLTLNGAGPQHTIVDAGAAGRLFSAGDGVVITGMRLQNGLTVSGNLFDESGGAILASGSLILDDVVLIDNHAVGSGGAIFNLGTLLLENTQVMSNTANGNGGALYNYTAGVITITHSTLAHNNAVGMFGGAIYAGGVSVLIQDSTVADNTAGTFGGGLAINMNGVVPTHGSFVLDGVTLTGNQTNTGAGIYAGSGAITATNVTVSANNATNNYGGIYVSGENASIFVQNSTIAYNTRTSSAGNGINGIVYGNNAQAWLVNTILAYNQESNCSSFSPPTSLGYNLATDFTCGLSQTGDLPGLNPHLGELADNGGAIGTGHALTHALAPGSPAIDAADAAYCPAEDGRGVARPYDGDGDGAPVCDMGAFEARHQVIVADNSVFEGDSGFVNAVFTVTLAPSHTIPVQIDYVTLDGSALGGSDYTPLTDTLTFAPGETEKFIQVPVAGDTADELDETFYVALTTPAEIDLLDTQAQGLIVDDDGLPALAVADQAILEGNAGVAELQFEVTLSPASDAVVTVDYTTLDGTATAGSDYTAVTDTLTFQPGETSQIITVDILGDEVDEEISEAFTLQLSNPTNAALADGEAVGTITDDDTAILSQGFGPEVFEGDSGFTPAVFIVTLSIPADFIVTVDYSVSSGYGDTGAVAGEDFVSVSGTLTYQPGQTVKSFTVQVIGDTQGEYDEIFWSLISNANVTISANSSNALIFNDDARMVYLPLIVR